MKAAIAITSLSIALAPVGASAGFFEEIITKPVEEAVEDEKRRTEDEVRDATRQELDGLRQGIRRGVSGALTGTRRKLGCMLRGNCADEPERAPDASVSEPSAAATPARRSSRTAEPAPEDCGYYGRWWVAKKPPPPAGCIRISPFGELEWGDDVLTVITKLAARGDIEQLHIGTRHYPAAALRSRAAARDAVQDVCAERAAILPADSQRIPGRHRHLCPAVGHAGGHGIVAYPITLAGTSFDLFADFTPDLEAIIEDRDVPVTDEFYVPFRLTGVRFHPSAGRERRWQEPRRLAASIRAIAERLESRYGTQPGVRVKRNRMGGVLWVGDEVGTSILVRGRFGPQYDSRTTHHLLGSGSRFHAWLEEQKLEHAPPEPAAPVSAADADL